jgi:hypothetical protein
MKCWSNGVFGDYIGRENARKKGSLKSFEDEDDDEDENDKNMLKSDHDHDLNSRP